VVKPTTAHAGTSDLDLLLGLLLDLTTSLPSVDRHERLVRSLAGALPCDSAALLRRQGEDLVPVAVHGLRADAVGRRFPRAEHPRLDAICAAPGPVQFPPDSPLPDPFDGFLASDPHALAAIHAAAGLAVLAHPTDRDLKRHLGPLRAMGLDGIEVHRPRAVGHLRERVERAARRHGLLVTGGSDWHGRYPDPPLGTWRVPEGVVSEALARLEQTVGTIPSSP